MEYAILSTDNKYDKNKESSYLNYWDVNNLYGSAMPKKPPTFNFKCFEDTSQFNEVLMLMNILFT